MEAEVGIEPTNGAFAELCLTTWLLRPYAQGLVTLILRAFECKNGDREYEDGC